MSLVHTHNDKPNFTPTVFVEVILPLAIGSTYTYRVPRELEEIVKVGCRVIVPFGTKKVYTGIVSSLHHNAPSVYEAKYIYDCMDNDPMINNFQLKFFSWISSYYMCTIGEVMNNALPSGLKISSQSFIQINPESSIEIEDLSDHESKIIGALNKNQRLSFDDVSALLGIKGIHTVLKSLIQKEHIIVFEQIKDAYKTKMIVQTSIAPRYVDSEQELRLLFEKLEKKPKQLEVLLKYLTLTKASGGSLEEQYVSRDELLTADLSRSSYKTLCKNGVFIEKQIAVSRLNSFKGKVEDTNQLSEHQEEALTQISSSFEQGKPVLLHGVTGSGKTEVYISLIQQALESGGQVLYLLPEIALTTQIVGRLYKKFGNLLGVYHSRYSDNERVETWKGVNDGSINLIAGVRSSVFLPFHNLSLIIIDEEHDASFKQYDPSPRFNGRDSAIWLSHLHGANVVLGTATPSLESYYNALNGKYALVTMKHRHGSAEMPNFVAANTLTAQKAKRMKGDFTPELNQAIQDTLDQKRQTIIFQNRRGYSPYLLCKECAHVPKCSSCDVSLTYHLHSNILACHYCGQRESVPAICGACGSTGIQSMGIGTQKLEEDMKILFPAAHIQRMDQDTTRSKYSYENIIDRFANGETNILVGTQMLSKGLHFENVSLVGIFDYDRMVHFPDFRSHERTFQLITQVSGRAGRSENQGEVIVQTAAPQSKLLALIVNNDYEGFYRTEIEERKKFCYPPFYKMIRIVLRNKDKVKLQVTSAAYAADLLGELGSDRVLGPQEPVISRIRNLFIEEIYIKVETKGISMTKVKQFLMKKLQTLQQNKRHASSRVHFDVDPV